MISLSHWGMFEDIPRMIVIPVGFKLSEQDMAEMRKPGGLIRIERV